MLRQIDHARRHRLTPIVVLGLLALILSAVLSTGRAEALRARPAADRGHSGATIALAICDGTPRLTVSSKQTLDVPIGAGSAIAPKITVHCQGSTLSGVPVAVSITPGSAATFTDPLPESGPIGDLISSANGTVSLPIVTSGDRDGSFTITASFQGARLRIRGEVVGRLAGSPRPSSDPARNDEIGTVALNCHARMAVSCWDLARYNAMRSDEHLGPLLLPSNWSALTVPDQLLVLTNLERTARGLPPYTGLAADLDRLAQAASDAHTDPSGEAQVTSFYRASPDEQRNPEQRYTTDVGRGLWASVGDPFLAMIGWIYLDGLSANGSSQNTACKSGDLSGCWGHRNALLNDTLDLACELRCAIGAATEVTGQHRFATSSDTELLINLGGNAETRLLFSWTRERRYLPACERYGDSCSWASQPTMIGPKRPTYI